jgi:light-harvesting protein B-800-850 alpha chain
MNQKEIWCVVNPSVGLPLFLGAVAVTSLIVHGSILTSTDWMAAYWQGGQSANVAMAPANAAEVPTLIANATTTK